MILHDYQERAVLKAGEWLSSSSPALFMKSPTGSGKTLIQSTILAKYPGGLQTAPTEEILDGFREHGAPESSLWTIKKLKNRLSEGVIDPSAFSYWQCDEAHHSVDNTHKEVDLFLASLRRIGWSATDFRGTPQETQKLRDWYAGNIYEVISLRDAASKGVISVPEFTVHPLVDDETVAVTAGEFNVSKVTAATREKLESLVHLIGKKYQDKGTMVALSSVALVTRFKELCDTHGIPCVAVTGDTSATDRTLAFRDVQERRKLLVQIAVVSEGVNLPGLRRLVDARPTMSPLFWMQLVGRVTRPGPDTPEVWVCNHNLLRHGYLFDGLVPAGVMQSALKVWGNNFQPSRRMVSRAVGLDGLGAFKPVPVLTASGDTVFFFALGTKTTQYAVVLRPGEADPCLIAKRQYELLDNQRNYAKAPKWSVVPKLPDMQGCTSVPVSPVSEDQVKWWSAPYGAKSYGLDVSQELNAKVFSILPVLSHTKRRLK